MKIQLSIFTLVFFLTGCAGDKPGAKTEPVVENNLSYYGDTITTNGSIPAEKLVSEMQGKDSIQIKLTGTIEEVCQKKGCWMNIRIGADQIMKVRFKDYAFFVPKDAAGKTVVIEGFAFTDTTSVAELKHYAEDAGKTKEEIEKITKPEINVGFEANGVIIQK